MKSLYGLYVNEREGSDIIETGYGFVTYRFEHPFCIVCNIFVREEERQKGRGAELIDAVAAIAKQRGLTHIAVSNDINAKTSLLSLKASIANGFKILKLEAPNTIWLFKEIQ